MVRVLSVLIKHSTQGALAVLLAGYSIVCAGALTNPLLELSLEQLFEIEVTSVNKTPQALAEVPTAIFVISAEDIRRSTATSLPELLRLAPGVDARRIDESHWAVSIRGFNSEFADKLLVLVDGVSVFSSIFSGVNWDELDMDFADIERIEVIRGPGAATWGVNAVNGVINIITRAARGDYDHRVSVAYGDNLRPKVGLAYNGQIGDALNYRVGGFFRRNGNSDGVTDRGDRAADDDWLSRRLEFRGDLDLPGNDQLSMILRGWNGQRRQISDQLLPIAPVRTFPHGGAEFRGGTALMRLQQTDHNQSRQWQIYFDYRGRDELRLDTQDQTLDLEFTQNTQLDEAGERVWGIGYRRLRNQTRGSFSISISPGDSTEDLFTGFFQQSWNFLAQRLQLTLGSKFEHSSRVGSHAQPSIKLRYRLDPQSVIWASVSRAVSTPALIETNGTLSLAAIDAGGLPGFITLKGDSGVDAETLIAYELGWRRRYGQSFSLDTTVFFHDYKGLLEPHAPGTPEVNLTPAPHVVIPFSFYNGEAADLYGLEIAGTWDVSPAWRLQASYSWMQMTGIDDFAAVISQPPPEQMLNLSSHLDIAENWQLDGQVRYNDSVPVLSMDSWWSLDIRLGWQATRDLELSVIAKELLGPEHFEFNDSISTESSSVGRSVLVRADWRF